MNVISRQASGTGRNYLLLSLVVVLLADQIFGFGLSLMPGLSFKNLYLYIIILYLVSSGVVEGRFLRTALPSLYLVFILLCIYGLASWAVANVVRTNYQTFEHLISLKNQLVDPVLFFSVLFFGCRNTEDAAWLAKRIALVFAIMSLVVLVDFLNLPNLGLIPDREDGRLEGAVDGSNGFATLLTFFVLAMTPMTLSRGRSLLIVVGSLAGLALILLTGSRGALAGLVVGAIGTTFALRRHLGIGNIAKLGGVALGALTIIVVVTVLLYPDMFSDRLERTGGDTLAAASSGRTAFWTQGLLRMWANPHSLLIGFGWDTFAYSRIYPDPHSHYLYIFYSMGAVGFGLYLWVLSSVFRLAISALPSASAEQRRLLIAFLFGFSTLLVSMMFATLYTVWPFVWAYIGLMTKLAWLAKNSDQYASGEKPLAPAGTSRLGFPAAMRTNR